MSLKSVIYNFIKAGILCLFTVGFALNDISVESEGIFKIPDSFLVMVIFIILRWNSSDEYESVNQKQKEYAVDAAQITGFYLITLYFPKLFLSVNIDLFSITTVFVASAVYLGLIGFFKREWIYAIATIIVYFLLNRILPTIEFIPYFDYGLSFILTLFVMIVILVIALMFRKLISKDQDTA